VVTFESFPPESPTFGSALSASRNPYDPSDPVNLVFVGDASADRVAWALQGILALGWRPSLTDALRHARVSRPLRGLLKPLYAYLDDRAHGGAAGWKLPDRTLVLYKTWSPLAHTRLHIRIYACHRPAHDSSGRSGEPAVWSVAAAHLEVYSPPLGHTVKSWKAAQRYIRRAFAKHPELVQAYFEKDTHNARDYQGVPFDGMVTYILLTPGFRSLPWWVRYPRALLSKLGVS